MSLKNSKEDYLRIAYILKKTKNQIRVTDVANELDRSKATVNIALKKLADEGYMSIEKYGDIKLTAKGEVEANKIIAANDVIKLFLKEIIKVDDKNLEEETKALKSSLSQDSINKLARYTYQNIDLKKYQKEAKCSENICVKYIEIAKLLK
jgi:Mn-dependent DtxR family transcriptional regulator